MATAREQGSIFRILVITGPRQAGKTTLAKWAFPDHAYINLEEPDVRAAAADDPRGFLGRFRDGLILDEVQRLPEILSYLQSLVDEDPRPGRFVLTGSANLLLMASVTQSLAGRAGFLELPTCTHDELVTAGKAPAGLEEAIIRGGYPEVCDRALPPAVWYNAYLSSVVERDLRQIVNVRDLGAFQRFLVLCAGRIGQLLNRTGLGSDAGVNAGTVDHWLSALTTAHLVFLLPPHFANLGKRLMKAPKLYFTDPALAARLIGITAAEQLASHPLRGPLVENLVVAEVRRAYCNRGEKPPLYYWRDRRGLEVDLLIDRGGSLHPVEIKAGATLASDWFRALARWRDLAGESAGPARVVCDVAGTTAWSDGTAVLPWTAAGSIPDLVDG